MNKNLLLLVIFTLLSLVIVSRFLGPGYLLSLDAVAVPVRTVWPSLWSTSFFYTSLVAVLNIFLPSDWIQKLLLFAIFFLAGWGMARLVPVVSNPAKVFAGLVYAVNPFVYGRVLVGHWGLLLGYSLLPFLVKLFIGADQSKKIAGAIIAAVLFTLIISIDVHFVLIFGPVLVLLSGLAIRNVRWLGIFWGLTLLLNLNWLISILIGRSELAEAVNNFSEVDLRTFQSLADQNYGLIFNLLSGYGLWAEGRKIFVLAKDIVSFWPLITIVLLGLGCLGIVRTFKSGDKKLKIMAGLLILTSLLALDLAGGVALPSAREMFLSLYDQFPVFRGLREPQKVIGILFFGYAYLGGGGVEYIWERLSGIKRQVVVGTILLIPFVYTPTVFSGFWGQLSPVEYPQSYFQVKKILDRDKGNFLVLAFPWHQYMRYTFNHNRPVTNLAPLFFGSRVLSSQNYETKYLDSHDSRPEALHISGLLRMETEGINLLGDKIDPKPEWSAGLAAANIKYVLLFKDDDWKDYGFLDEDGKLRIIHNDNYLRLYQNDSWGTLPL